VATNENQTGSAAGTLGRYLAQILEVPGKVADGKRTSHYVSERSSGYARATQAVLEAAVEKLTKPLGQVVYWTKGRINGPASSTYLTNEGRRLD